MTNSEDHPESDRFRKLVRESFEGKPSYEATRDNAITLTRMLREEIAQAIEQQLNEYVVNAKPTTYEQKISLTNWINDELRALGLALSNSKTDRPGFLQTAPNHGGVFRFMYRDEQGKRHSIGGKMQYPYLKLVPSDARFYGKNQTSSDKDAPSRG